MGNSTANGKNWKKRALAFMLAFSMVAQQGSVTFAGETDPAVVAAAEQEAAAAAQAESERIAREQAEAEAKAKAEEEARIKAEEEARTKAEAEEKARQESEAKAKAEAEAKAKAEAEAKAKAESEAKAKAESEAAAKAKEESEEKAAAESEKKAKEESEKAANAESSTEAASTESQNTPSETKPETEIQSESQKETEIQSETSDAHDADAETTVSETQMSETETAASESETESETETEEEFKSGILRESGNGYQITLTYDETARIPEEARIVSREIVQGTAEYEALLAQAHARMGITGAVDKAVTQARFFDITIVDKKGRTLEPESGVTVEITYSKPVEVENANDIDMVHFAEGGAEILDVEATKVNQNGDIKKIEFEADSFSTYGLIYTVDFTYKDGYTYQMPGGEQMLLSELFDALDINESTANVIEVVFTDDSLLTVEKTEDDYVLKSLKPFTSEETLTVTVNDPATSEVVKYVVEVHDDTYQDLSNFTQSVSIGGATENSDGSLTVQSGVTYTVSLSFAEKQGREESDSKQFSEDSLTYQMPNGFRPMADHGTFTISGTDSNGSYTVEGNTYSVDENGKVTVNWNKTSDAWSRLQESGTVAFQLNFEGTFDENVTQLDFGNGVTKNLTVDTDCDATVDKSGYYDPNTNKVYYTVTVHGNKGNSTNVNVVDTLSGSALTLDVDSLQITSAKGKQFTPTKNSLSGDGFNYTIDKVQQGDTITFAYTASVNTEYLTGNGTIEQTANGVKITTNEKPGEQEKNIDLNNQISYTNIGKAAGDLQEGEPGHKIIPWTVTYNQGSSVSAAGRTITDRIDSGSTSVMDYSGTGITVLVKDRSGNVVRTDNVPWGSGVTKGDHTWSYMIPNSDTEAYSYIISYTTDVDTTQLLTDVTVKNGVEDDKNHHADGSKEGVGPGENGKIGVEKKAVEVSQSAVSWEVTVKVPAGGLTSAQVVDTYPFQQNHYYQDTLSGDISISGLINGDYYSIDTSDTSKATIVFYQDESHSVGGLRGTGEAREITVTFKTNIDQTWLSDSSTQSYLKEHKNTVAFTGNGTTVTAEASAYPVEQTIEKKTTESGKTSDGLPYYKYELILSGVSGDITINEAFDNSILDFYEPDYTDAGHIYGGDQYYQGTDSGHVVSYDSAAKTMKVSGSNLAKDKGNYYGYYRIVYYLKVKDAAALKALQQKAQNEGGTTTIENTATWDTITSNKVTSNYSYEGVTKETIHGPEKEEDGFTYVTYKIVFNPSAVKLGETDTLTATDEFSNLSIVYDSITATPSENVTWDVRSNTAIFTIPNETAVTITYKAKVLGTGSVPVSNEAKLEYYSKKKEDTINVVSSGSGTASNLSINILKYKDGDMTTRLQGAEFALYFEDGEPVRSKNTGEQVTAVTNARGIATFSGGEKTDGWSLIKNQRYYFVETKAPDHYQKSNRKYYFTISDEAQYSQFIYYDGDTMTFRNTPIPVNISVSKSVKSPVESDHSKLFKFIIKAWTIGQDEQGEEIRIPVGSQDSDKEHAAVITTNSTGASEETKVTFTPHPDVSQPYGQAEFSLKDDQTIVITVDEGTVYEITEDLTVADAELFEVSPENAPGTAAGTIPSATFTNTKKKSSLTIQKTFNVDTGFGENAKKRLEFVIEGPDAGGEGVDTRTLTYDEFTNGQYTINNLPIGASYTVTETNAGEIHDRYVLVSKESTTEGTVNALSKEGDTVNLTNKYEKRKAGLTIRKSFGGDDIGEEAKKALEIKVIGKDVNPGTTGNPDVLILHYSDFASGEYTINGLPVGESYTVTETNAANLNVHYTLITKDSTTEVSDLVVSSTTNAVAELYNVYEQKHADLKIKKTFSDEAPTDQEKEALSFTITGKDAGGKGIDTLTVTYAEFTNGEYVIKQLPAGETYQVTETNADSISRNYTLIVTGDTASMTSGSAVVTAVEQGQEPTTIELKNNYERKKGKLKITKSFETDNGEIPADVKNNLSFTITGKDIGGTGTDTLTVTYGEFSDGVYIKDQLPAGETYTVTETNAGSVASDITETNGKVRHYTLVAEESTTEGSAVVINDNNQDVVTIDLKNKYHLLKADLNILKSFTGDDVSKLSEEQKNKVTFTVTGPDGFSDTFTYGSIQNGRKAYTGINPGTYTVTETNETVDGFTVVKTYAVTTTVTEEVEQPDGSVSVITRPQTIEGSNEVLLGDGGKATVTVTNTVTQLKGGLTITKTFAGDTGELTEAQKNAIKFTVTGPVDTTFGDSNTNILNLTYADFKNGRYTVDGLIPGQYKVKESNNRIAGYQVTTTYQVGTVITEGVETSITVPAAAEGSSGGAAISFTNTYRKEEAELTVTKTFTGNDAAKLTSAQKEGITFQVTGPGSYSESFSYADMTDGSMKLEHLVPGEYTVTETNNVIDGFAVTTTYSVSTQQEVVATAPTVTLEDQDKKAVSITNDVTQLLGKLTITKLWTGNYENLKDEYKNALTFKIVGPEGCNIGGTGVDELTVKYADFSNKNENKHVIEKLIPGTYTVTENNTRLAGYDVTTTYQVDEKASRQVSLTVENAAVKDGSITVNNNYHKRVGKLTVKKTWVGETEAALQKLITDHSQEMKNVTFTVTGPAGWTLALLPSSATDADKNAAETATEKTFKYEDMIGGSITFTGIPEGEYTVSETNETVEGFEIIKKYTVSEEETDELTLSDGEEKTFEVTNTVSQTTGSLKITKNVLLNLEETSGTEADGTYIFHITGPQNYQNDVRITIAHGVAQTQTVPNLLPGTYTITEDTTGFETRGIRLIGQNPVTVKVESGNDASEADIPTAVFTNNREITGSLSVRKNLTGNAADDLKDTEEFEFKVYLTKADGSVFDDILGAQITGYKMEDSSDTHLPLSFDVYHGEITFKLKANERAVFEHIPTGLTASAATTQTKYVIVESESEIYDYDTTVTVNSGSAVSAVEAEGTIEADRTQEVSYINKIDLFGDLYLRKVISGTAGDKTKKFHVTITADSSIAGKSFDVSPASAAEGGKVTFSSTETDGKVSSNPITIKHNETVTVKNLPNGVHYSILETEADLGGYATSYTYKTSDSSTETMGIIKGKPTYQDDEEQNNLVTITNSKDLYGGLTISKELHGNSKNPNQEFQFTIDLKDVSFSGKEYACTIGTKSQEGTTEPAVTYTNSKVTFDETGKATFSIKGNQSWTILGLPNDQPYTVTENDYSDQGYLTTVIPAGKNSNEISGKIVGHEVSKEKVTVASIDQANKAAFLNTRNEYNSLTVMKHSTGNAADTNTSFQFIVTISGITSESSFDKELAKGTIYGKDGNTKTGAEEITAHESDKAGVYTYSFSLADGESIRIEKLPNGAHYKVDEQFNSDTDAAEYVTTYTTNDATSGTVIKGNEGDIHGEATAPGSIVEVENRKDRIGGLLVKKQTAGNDANKKTWFAFKITLDDPGFTTESGANGRDVYFVNGVSKSVHAVNDADYQGDNPKVPADYFKVSVDASHKIGEVLITNLPAGMGYTIEEADYSGVYDSVEVTGNVTGTINGIKKTGEVITKTDIQTDNTVSFKNTRNRYGKLCLEKVIDGTVTDTTKQFTFTVKLTDAAGNALPQTDTNNHTISGITLDSSGMGTVSLRAGSTKTIKDIPVGSRFEVIEAVTNVEGFLNPMYQVTAEDIDAYVPGENEIGIHGIIGSKQRTVTVTNTTTNVRVKKVDENGVPVPGATFEIRKNNGEVVRSFETSTSVNELEGLPVDVIYTIVETDAPEGYAYYSDEEHLVKFKILPDGKVINLNDNKEYTSPIVLTDNKLKFDVTKVDETGKTLSGAVIALLDNEKKEVARWTSGENWETSFDFGSSLKAGETYTLTELRAPKSYRFFRDIELNVAKDGTITTTPELQKNSKGSYLLVDAKASVPSFEKKIKDKNDTAGTETGWQDSADYDIGDEVPYKLTAKLADNVTDYRSYHITFHDVMESGLTFKEITGISVIDSNGTAFDSGFVRSDSNSQHSFDLTLTWSNGESKIGKEQLNGASVEVYFSAILNEDAVLGAPGNVNKAQLEYSNNPNVNDQGAPSDETDKTDWDYVIAFTYKVDVNKTDSSGNALTGAAFKLEKIWADGHLSEVNLDTDNSTDTLFSFRGLDDGDYLLTETLFPVGYKGIDPVRFTVEAGHADVWDVTEDSTRGSVLTGLSGNLSTGELTFTPSDRMEGLVVDVKNSEASKPEFQKKIKDTNDTTGEVTGWQDSADYDIGDEIPYQLTATLTDNVTNYYKYSIEFHDVMEKSLTFQRIESVKVGGKDLPPANYTMTKKSDQEFSLELFWDGGADDEKIKDAFLNKAKVEVIFYAKLNENAVLGKQGNVNKAELIYSNNPNLKRNMTPGEEDRKRLPWDSVIVFTYQTVINKVDASGAALAGAEFKLEKTLKSGGTETISRVTVADGNKFTFTGLDDGEYTLTETTTPTGYTTIAPIKFTVSAAHNEMWNGTDRTSVLTELTGNVTSGTLKLAADADLKTLTGNVTNTKAGGTGSIEVTKYTLKKDRSFKVSNETYYTALFSDAALSNRVSDVKALVLRNAYTTSVTFTNLAFGTYYVGETNAAGTPVSTAANISKVEIENGTVSLSGVSPTGSAVIKNTVPEGVLGAYADVRLKISKKVQNTSGDALKVNDTFYFALYSDAACTKRIKGVDIISVKLNGASSGSATFRELPYSSAFYVAEVDKNGKKVASSDSFNYKVTVSGDGLNYRGVDGATVTVTNKRKKGKPAAANRDNGNQGAQGQQAAVRTGDTTPVMPMLITMITAGLAALYLAIRRRRRV